MIKKIALIAAAALIAGCGGGGGAGAGSSVAPSVGLQTPQAVSGTLQIAVPSALTASSRARVNPFYVSQGTGHAAVFIDHANAPVGSTTTCAATTSGTTGGTGTGCTISWSTNIIPGTTHVFTVEIDTGTTVLPHNTVLAVGQGSYTIFSGPNPLGTSGWGSPLALNGVAASWSYSFASCSGSSCPGTVYLFDAAGYDILYNGANAPTQGQTPTSGNVLDNDGYGVSGPASSNVAFASDTSAVGVIGGSGQAPFSTVTANLLTINGVNNGNGYSFTATCNASATGVFGIKATGGAVASGDLTAAEISGLTLTYPTGPASTDTPLIGCNAGVANNTPNSSIVVNSRPHQ